MQSDKGFPYSTVILISGIVIAVLFGIMALAVGNPIDVNATDWQFFAMLGVSQLFFGIAGSMVFPNAKQITLFEDHIEIQTKKGAESIQIREIQRISKYSSFASRSFNKHEFYKIELREPSVFGKSIYFRIKTKNRAAFIQALEMAWVKAHKKVIR